MWHEWSSSNDSIRIHFVAANLGNWHQFPAGHAFLPDAAASLFLFTFKCQRIIASLLDVRGTVLIRSFLLFYLSTASRRIKNSCVVKETGIFFLMLTWIYLTRPKYLAVVGYIFLKLFKSRQFDSTCKSSVANLTRGEILHEWMNSSSSSTCLCST